MCFDMCHKASCVLVPWLATDILPLKHSSTLCSNSIWRAARRSDGERISHDDASRPRCQREGTRTSKIAPQLRLLSHSKNQAPVSLCLSHTAYPQDAPRAMPRDGHPVGGWGDGGQDAPKGSYLTAFQQEDAARGLAGCHGTSVPESEHCGGDAGNLGLGAGYQRQATQCLGEAVQELASDLQIEVCKHDSAKCPVLSQQSQLGLELKTEFGEQGSRRREDFVSDHEGAGVEDSGEMSKVKTDPTTRKVMPSGVGAPQDLDTSCSEARLDCLDPKEHDDVGAALPSVETRHGIPAAANGVAEAEGAEMDGRHGKLEDGQGSNMIDWGNERVQDETEARGRGVQAAHEWSEELQPFVTAAVKGGESVGEQSDVEVVDDDFFAQLDRIEASARRRAAAVEMLRPAEGVKTVLDVRGCHEGSEALREKTVIPKPAPGWNQGQRIWRVHPVPETCGCGLLGAIGSCRPSLHKLPPPVKVPLDSEAAHESLRDRWLAGNRPNVANGK